MKNLDRLRTRFFLFFAGLSIAVSLIVGFFIYYQYENYIKHNYMNTMDKVSLILESQYPILADPDYLEKLALADSEEYWSIQRMFQALTDTFNMDITLTRRLEGFDDLLQLVIDARRGQKEMDKPEILFSNRYIESYVDPLIPIVYETKTVQTAKKPYSNAYGNMVSEFRPIMKDGAVATVLELDYDISFLDHVRQQARIALLVSLILAILLAGILAIGLSGSLTRPIGKLAAYARRIGEGDLDSKITIKGKDEIAELGTILSKMTMDIKEYINNLNRVTAEKERINSELNVASDIQNDMLPHISPTFSNNKGFSIFAKMEPAKEVGGDFYDFFYLDPAGTKIVLVIADVSGKSVPAALFMVIAKTLIKQQMLHYGDPAAVLDHVNKVLCEDNPRCMFVTVFICSIDLTTGQMIYANGGHNPPLLASGEHRTIGSVEAAESNQPYQFIPLKKGIPLGMMETSRYKTSFLQLNYGDKLYLYTDGINEAMNVRDDQFGNDRFLETANKFRNLPPKEFDEAIRREVEGFIAGAEQSDDITTLSMRYTGRQTV